MPLVKPAALGQVAYASPSATDSKHWAPALKTSGALVVSSSVKALTMDGEKVGTATVLRIKPGPARSETFQYQFVVQLINAVAGPSASPRFVRADGQVMALATGAKAVAGWFEGDQVILVYRQGKTPDLAALALAVRSSPRRG
jgi:hypothetical protein